MYCMNSRVTDLNLCPSPLCRSCISSLVSTSLPPVFAHWEPTLSPVSGYVAAPRRYTDVRRLALSTETEPVSMFSSSSSSSHTPTAFCSVLLLFHSREWDAVTIPCSQQMAGSHCNTLTLIQLRLVLTSSISSGSRFHIRHPFSLSVWQAPSTSDQYSCPEFLSHVNTQVTKK